MTQVTIHQAKTNLSKLIAKVMHGEQVVIAKRDQPLVRLERIQPAKRKRKIGWGKGLVKFVASDFDAPLEDFAEYMETAGEERLRLRRNNQAPRRK
jgi:prevent-host-death family protein